MVEAILTATSRVLVRRGYEGTSTTLVARVAGVSIGSLYQYFPTKEALIAALVDDHIDRVLSLLAGALANLHDKPLEEAVRTLIRAILLVHAVDPELHAALTRNFSKVEGLEKVRALNTHAIEAVTAYLRRRQDPVRPRNLELAAFILVHSVQAVVSAAAVEPSVRFDDEGLIDELALLVLNFLK